MLLALLGSSTVLFHQIAGYTLAVLLGVISILFPPYLLRRDGRRGVYLLLSLAALGIFSVFCLGHLTCPTWWRECSAVRRRGGR